MSLTVMMTSAASALARDTQRITRLRGDLYQANVERIDAVEKAHMEMLSAPSNDLEPYIPNGDPFESGATIWDVLQTIRQANDRTTR